MDLPSAPQISMEQASAAWGGQYIHGISTPMKELEEPIMNEMKEAQAKEIASRKHKSELSQYMAQPTESDMQAANLGVRMAPPVQDNVPMQEQKVDPKRFKKFKGKKPVKSKGKRR